MSRSWYSASIPDFLSASPDTILGTLTRHSTFPVEAPQREAWLEQIELLRPVLSGRTGEIHFEFAIPRMGRRIDVVLVLGPSVFVLEFKVGEKDFPAHALDQVTDYALDLKNFHETSHACWIAPVLIATRAPDPLLYVTGTPQDDQLLAPICSNVNTLPEVVDTVLAFCADGSKVPEAWAAGSYHPTPTIVEAAMALYRGHKVVEISRSDAGAINLSETSAAVSEVIADARARGRKVLCFVTGIPGAGKTLVGLNVATEHSSVEDGLHSVFLSGNGPLVAVLREALARDKVRAEAEQGTKLTKGAARRAVETFIQNVHHFRDDCLIDAKPPREHVALFDEAQRAWDAPMLADFMKRKKGKAGFTQSEPEFLISCLDRHLDWAVVVCLVGGGQEINRGEAGIGEWAASIQRSFPHWDVRLSSRLTDSEYAAGEALAALQARPNTKTDDRLHLSVSMRSFRAEHVSLFVKQLLDGDVEGARTSLVSLKDKFPIVLARSLPEARDWLRRQARGSERYGILVSSQAYRLKPHAIDVRAQVDPVHWFLDGKDDVRSSYYLEDAATEFQVQGLELDWACVTWDGDFRFVPDSLATPSKGHWEHWSFVGNAWQRVKKAERQRYLKNAYRVLLTRARQGMVIVVPEGDSGDLTRNSGFYDGTWGYLRALRVNIL
jgi:hypothetical protein